MNEWDTMTGMESKIYKTTTETVVEHTGKMPVPRGCWPYTAGRWAM
ncbi:MAG: hypothetical protein HZA50_00825 [Planctomycetes bacterium]|nr:hypothetical protein [Planctomycetota bacterium]